MLTLSAHIMAGAAAHDRCPLVFATGDGEHATTLGALVSDAEKVAAAFQARSIGPGDVVVVQLPGSYEGAVIQTAVGMCGAVLLPVVMIYGAREQDRDKVRRDVRWAHGLLVWSSTELAHKLSGPYVHEARTRRVRVVTCSRRGLPALLHTAIQLVGRSWMAA